MKGVWRTVESVFAVVILVSFLLSAGSVYFKGDETDIGRTGYEMLKELDARGELRAHAAGNDHEAINSKIEIPGYNHSVSICDYGGKCTGEYPDSSNIVVSTYLISGYGEYGPEEVRLYIWW